MDPVEMEHFARHYSERPPQLRGGAQTAALRDALKRIMRDAGDRTPAEDAVAELQSFVMDTLQRLCSRAVSLAAQRGGGVSADALLALVADDATLPARLARVLPRVAACVHNERVTVDTAFRVIAPSTLTPGVEPAPADVLAAVGGPDADADDDADADGHGGDDLDWLAARPWRATRSRAAAVAATRARGGVARLTETAELGAAALVRAFALPSGSAGLDAGGALAAVASAAAAASAAASGSRRSHRRQVPRRRAGDGDGDGEDDDDGAGDEGEGAGAAARGRAPKRARTAKAGEDGAAAAALLGMGAS
jgi:hypothetical protein